MILFDKRIRYGSDPALVIAHGGVSFRAKALDIAAKLIGGKHGAAWMLKQHHHRIDALFPQNMLLLRGADLPVGKTT